LNYKNAILLIGIINIILIPLYFSSCSTFRHPPKGKINLKTPANNIKSLADNTKDLADVVKDKAPEAEAEADAIKENQDNIKKEAKNIIDLQPEVDRLNKALTAEKEKRLKAEKAYEEKRVNGLIKLLYWFVGAGMIALIAGIVMCIKGIIEPGWQIALLGAIVLGLSIATIKYIFIIAITFGIIIILGILFGVYQIHAYMKKSKEHDEETSIVNDLMETFHETDKDIINKWQSEKTQLRVAEHKVQKRKKKVLVNG